MAGSEYYGDVTVGGRSLNDATPAEWDKAYENTKLSVDDITYVDNNPPLSDDWKVFSDTYQFNTFNPNDYNPRIEYKFREGELIQELQSYIDKTYDQHYAGGKIQATEDIIDDGHGTGFCIGNAKKYLKRYGKKGETPAEWRKDIIKVLHYGLIQLYIHDLEHGNNTL